MKSTGLIRLIFIVKTSSEQALNIPSGAKASLIIHAFWRD